MPMRTGSPGIQQLAHDANLLYYMSEEAAEGRQAYLEKRAPDFGSSRIARDDGGDTESVGADRHPDLGDGRRLRTLPAAVAPVLVGTSLAGFAGVFHAPRFIAALLGAIFIQVGTNLSNDYSDARRGAAPRTVSVLCGSPRAGSCPRARCSWRPTCVRARGARRRISDRRRRWQLLLVGVASILAGCCTRRPAPYGYEGLGEVFVFLFFGDRRGRRLLLRAGPPYDWEAFALAVPVGLLATAILVVNNIRDIDTDRRAGKRTLAVRLGRDARAPCSPDVYLAFASRRRLGLADVEP